MYIPSTTYSENKVPNLQTLAKMSLVSFQNRPQHIHNQKIDFSRCIPLLSETDTPTIPTTLDMRYEAHRLGTFANVWPLSFIKPKDLAAVGLFYLGVQDRVQCAFCKGIISNWDPNDKPVSEHARHFPFCPFLLNRDVGNVPLSGINGFQRWQTDYSHPENVAHNSSSQNKVFNNLGSKYPTMSSLDKRLDTYHNWPETSVMRPKNLAEAGLFYTGVADVVTCFNCACSMADWASGDEAWTEHAKHKPQCTYVLTMKGSAFVESARHNFTDVSEDVTGCYSEVSEESSDSLVMEITPHGAIVSEASIGEASTSSQESPSESDGKKLCKICMEVAPRAVFVPCGHSSFCVTCAGKVKVCPICRKNIQSAIRLYSDD